MFFYYFDKKYNNLELWLSTGENINFPQHSELFFGKADLLVAAIYQIVALVIQKEALSVDIISD